MATPRIIVLETKTEHIAFSGKSGHLLGLTAKSEPGEQLLAPADDHPAFALQYLDVNRQYRHVDSIGAKHIKIHVSRANSQTGIQTLTMEFQSIAGLELDVTITVRASKSEAMSRWSIRVDNRTGFEIVDVQFPFVVVPYGQNADAGNAIVQPFYTGTLIPNPKPSDLLADWPEVWQFNPRNGPNAHYPGQTFAQFIAYYTRKSGIYIACDDTQAHVKIIKALHRDPGIRLGIAHVGDWPTQGARRLEYDVIVGTFQGDWYAAAEIYRQWALAQKWATPLHKRKDVPEWILDSPVHITLRVQGIVDDGPVFPVQEFLPYEKSIPMLERIAARVEAPLVPVLMTWERAGPWVYPDCFPPIGGDESITRFAALARERGWHVGSFCNGSRWAIAHSWNRYDGQAYYEENNGEQSVCRLPNGAPWRELWDASWRPSYTCCLGANLTRKIARDFVKRLIGWGLESIQFFDQNVGAATFPCFSHEHGHVSVPGRWMAEAMAETVSEFHQEAAAAGKTQVLQSVEQPANETALQFFQQCDVRNTPPGTDKFIPMYQYIYHECIVMHGMMSPAPEPYHLTIANAYNGVVGVIPGAVMIGDGTLLNKDSWNWAPWEPRIGSNDDSLEMIRTVSAIRRGVGKAFLVYGRMLTPLRVDSIRRIAWQTGSRNYQIDAVFHSAWCAVDGRLAVVLANWTADPQEVAVVDSRLGKRATLHIAGRTKEKRSVTVQDGRLPLTLPPLSFTLIECGHSKSKRRVGVPAMS